MLVLLSVLAPLGVAQQGTETIERTSIDGLIEPARPTWLQPRPAATRFDQAVQRMHWNGQESPPSGTPGFLSGGTQRADMPGPAISLALSTPELLSVNEEPEGDMPRETAFLPDGSATLVVHRDTDSVSVFDIASQSITHTVAVGDFPVHIAVAADGLKAVVANVVSNDVSVLDLSPLPVGAPTVAATIRVTGTQPHRVAITPDSNTAVVGVINDGISSAFSVISLVSLAETASHPSAPQGVYGGFFSPESAIFGNLFTQFALTPDGSTIVLPDRGGARVVIYDVSSGAELADLPTNAGPTSVDISADGLLAVIGHEFGTKRLSTIALAGAASSVTHAFVTGDLQNGVIALTADKSHAIGAISNNAVFVNLTTGTTTATLFTGTVGDIELSFDGQYAFVSNFNSAVIDVASQTIVKTLSVAPTADAAASPVAHRVVGLNNRFREDVHLYDTNGASASTLAVLSSGEPNEGDAPRTLAVAPDGLTLVSANNISRNVAIVDLPTRSVRGYAEAGDRPLGVAVSPDGTTAVVCNGDADTVSIVDLGSGTRVADLVVSSRPAEVVISPDSSTAYVTSIAGTDRVHFIDLAGAASTVTGSIVSGQMGSVIATYNAFSGLAVSPDGSAVAVCISFDHQLLLIDTSTQTQIVKVTVGDFPLRVAFSPDSSTAWVLNAFGDSVSVVNVNGVASSVIATVPAIEFPLTVTLDEAGTHAYVGNFDGNNPRLHVINTTTFTKVANLVLPSPARAAHLSSLDGRWYAATTGGELVSVTAAGPASTLDETVALSIGPSDMVYSESLRLAVAAQPGADDAVEIVDTSLDPWTDLGAALAGTHGEPRLVIAGTLGPDSLVRFTVANALVGSSNTLVMGFVQLGAPFKGGTMVPTPTLLYPGIPNLPSSSGAAGFFSATTLWPAGVPPAFAFYVQAWMPDAAGPAGFASTNGVEGVTP
jgi:DNA-binding beta-propeller fold protein YncE